MIPNTINTWFTGYVDSFKPGTRKAAEMIAHKRSHSYRVAELSLALSDELGWTDDDRSIAGTIGLIHDCGRFPQVVAHESYIDVHTFDHGEEGCRVIIGENILNGYGDADRTAILDAVRYHNNHNIPDGLPERSIPFVRLIRDADKVDIFKSLLKIFRSKAGNNRDEYIMRKKQDSRLSSEAIQDIRNGETVSHHHIETESDMVLMLMSWVYDIFYDPAIARIADAGYIGSLAALLPQEDDISDIIDNLCDVVSARQAGLITRTKR